MRKLQLRLPSPRKGARVVIGVVRDHHISILVGAAIVIMTLGLSCPALNAQTAKLVIAENARYATDAGAAWLNLSDPVPPPTLFFSECNVQGVTRHLVYGGAVRLPHAGQWQCTASPKEIYLIDSPYERAYTVVRFNDGKTTNTLTIPAIHAIQSGVTITVGPVWSDDEFRTTVTVFAEKLTRVFVTPVDANGSALPEQSFDALGPTQYRLAGSLPSGSLRISTGSYIGATLPLYGYVDVSTGNGAGTVLPF